MSIPIYLHPIIAAVSKDNNYGFDLAGPSLGFQQGVASCFMRMVLAGIFDQFPNLCIILGHLGETLPYSMERLDFTFVKPWFIEKCPPKIKRRPSEVLRENVYITISGRYYEPALKYAIEALGSDRLIFASDYPYEEMSEGVSFIQGSSLDKKVQKQIFSENAEHLFSV